MTVKIKFKDATIRMFHELNKRWRHNIKNRNFAYLFYFFVEISSRVRSFLRFLHEGGLLRGQVQTPLNLHVQKIGASPDGIVGKERVTEYRVHVERLQAAHRRRRLFN